MLCIIINLNGLEDIVSRCCFLLPGKTFFNNAINETVLCIDIVPNTIILHQTCKLGLFIKYKFPSVGGGWHCTCNCVDDGIKNKKCIYYINPKHIGIKEE